jgi:hypothetical protein
MDEKEPGEIVGYSPDIEPDKEALIKSFKNGQLSLRIYKRAEKDILKDDRIVAASRSDSGKQRAL